VSRMLIAIAALLVGLPALRALDQPPEKAPPAKPQTPAEQFRALSKEYSDAQNAFFKAYRAAKTDAEREKLSFPSADKQGKQIFELAKKHPHEPFAVDALIWLVRNQQEQDDVLAILAGEHAKDKRVTAIAPKHGQRA
jgi:hypothetical protein